MLNLQWFLLFLLALTHNICKWTIDLLRMDAHALEYCKDYNGPNLFNALKSSDWSSMKTRAATREN